jgi:hypothetical protein
MEDSNRSEITKKKNLFHAESTHNPALDYLVGKVIFKEKLQRAEETLKKYGLPKEVMEKLQKEQKK